MIRHNAASRQRILVMLLITLLSILVVGCSTSTSSTSTKPASAAAQSVRTLIAFDPAKQEFAENLAIDSQGDIYVTLLQAGEVRRLTPDGKQAAFFLPVGKGGSVTGITFDEQGRLYVLVGSPDAEKMGIWQLYSDGSSRRIAALPTSIMPNGMTVDKQGNLYAADSKGGIIWRVLAGSNKAERWLQHPLIAPQPHDVQLPNGAKVTLSVGPNGLHFFQGNLYVSVSGQATLVRVPLNWDGSPGTPAVYLKNVSIDDFIFDSSGNLYLDANRSGGLIANEIERVKPDGTYTTLASDANGLDEPSAVEFGTGAGEQGKLYITNIGMFSAAKHPSLEMLSLNA